MKKKMIALGLLVACALALGLGTWISQENNTASPPPTPQIISANEYKSLNNNLLAILVEQDPKEALAELKEALQRDSRFFPACHALVHSIGRAAMAKYGDFAIALIDSDPICNSGYIHGVIEGYFKSGIHIESAMKTMCDQYVPKSFLESQCFHGAGHGAMFYTDNDLPRSLALCDTYQDFFAHSHCTNGVFMENFNTEQKIHPSSYLSATDPSYPCGEQTESNKKNCYAYVAVRYLNLHRNDYGGALLWCGNIEHAFRDACAFGVGVQTMRENVSNPKFVEQVCASGIEAQINPCIYGMTTLLIDHYGSLDLAFCTTLEHAHMDTCMFAIQSSVLLK